MANSWESLVDQVLALQDEPRFDASPPPAMQWYFSQWYSDDIVMMMGWAARGVHHHLLGVAWRQRPPCSLPVDDRKLRALCQNPVEWEAIWQEIREAWRPRAGRLWQVGLVKGYLSAMGLRRARADSARKRWKPKALRANAEQKQNFADAKRYSAEPNAPCSSSSSSSSSSPTDNEPPSVGAAPPAAPPRTLSPQQQVVERAWAIYDRFEGRRPTGGIITSWWKLLKKDTERLCRLLEDEGPRGGLSKGEPYTYGAIKSELAGGGNGKAAATKATPPNFAAQRQMLTYEIWKEQPPLPKADRDRLGEQVTKAAAGDFALLDRVKQEVRSLRAAIHA